MEGIKGWFPSDVPFTMTIKGDLELSDDISLMRAKAEVADDEGKIWCTFELSSHEGDNIALTRMLLREIRRNATDL